MQMGVSEHTFKALQSGNGMRAINSSIKDIIVTFLLGNLLTYTFKQMVASVAKRIAQANGSFSILRIHTVFELSEKIIRAFTMEPEAQYTMFSIKRKTGS